MYTIAKSAAQLFLVLVAALLVLAFSNSCSDNTTGPVASVSRADALAHACAIHDAGTGQICFQYYAPGGGIGIGKNGPDAWGIETECIDAAECSGGAQLADKDYTVPEPRTPCYLETRCIIGSGPLGPFFICSRQWVCPEVMGDDK